MRRILRKQKIFLSLALIVELLLVAPPPASAGLFGGGGVKAPTASQMAAELENRYNLNLGSLQNQGQGLNVADNKKQAPEVMLYFAPTDPKVGEKLTARAFPMFFTNTEDSLYYTWYLKHAECGLTKSPSVTEKALCDRDDDGDITVEDWKIEAARIVAQNGFTLDNPVSSDFEDDDGYKARMGGDNKANTPNRCFVHDNETGLNYQFVKSLNGTSSGCTSGKAVCLVGEGQVSSGTNDLSGGNSYFDITDSQSCYTAGYPVCSSSVATCSTGTLRCLESDAALNSCGSAPTSTECTIDTESSAQPYCSHIFPHAENKTSGDGTFGRGEENFWGTDPSDPDTAGNGNKDEANVVGLGQSAFTWNYVSGDKVGVAVEGTSLVPTKNEDASGMIMWAFAKNDCSLRLADRVGAYVTSIKGYSVNIPAVAGMDINKCIAYLDGDGKEHEGNLVDPTEGGQATNLEVAVSATPDAPVNDESGDRGGDIIAVQASINNSDRGLNNVLFDWTVEISDNIQFLSAVGNTADITDDLVSLGLMGNIRGNALDAVRLKMDLPNRAGVTLGGQRLEAYLNNDVGYLRLSVRATENFSNGILRRGRGNVIVTFTSTGKKITAYKPGTEEVGNKMRVRLSGGSVICNSDPLERTVCPVVKNEIIGLKIDPSGLSHFQWSVNGQALVCTRASVSPDCENEEQTEVNFMPISGNTGDTYTVTVAATDIPTGAAVNLSRTFHVVEPQVFIEPVNADLVWPKLIGQYRDISGTAESCPDGLCNDYSASVFQATAGSELAFRAKFIPSFLEGLAAKEWLLDDVRVEEDTSGGIRFTANKPAPAIYNVRLAAQAVQSAETRRALFDIWNISPLETPEMNFSVQNQVEIGENELAQGPMGGAKRALAAVASYIPASLLFSFRILLSAVLIIFVTGFLFALIPPQSRLLDTRRKFEK